MTYQEFRELVANLRLTQKNYFKTRDSALLSECRRLEKAVDEALKSQAGQGDLFK